MKEEFVPFELAKKLKEKGFEFGTFHHYNEDGTINAILPEPLENKPLIPCPTIAQVLKWLREKNCLHISTHVWRCGWYFEAHRFYLDGKDVVFAGQSEDYDSCEDSMLAGIKYALDNLI